MGLQLHTTELVTQGGGAPHLCRQAPMGLSAGTTDSLCWLDLVVGIPFWQLGG